MFLIRVDLSLNKCFTWMLIVALSWKAKLCLINWVSTLQSIRISLCLIKGCLPTTLLNRKPNVEALASYELLKKNQTGSSFTTTPYNVHPWPIKWATSLFRPKSPYCMTEVIRTLESSLHSSVYKYKQKIMNSSVVESIAEILSVSENTWNKHNFLPSSERALSGISVTIYFQVCCFCLPCLLSWCRRIAHGQKTK